MYGYQSSIEKGAIDSDNRNQYNYAEKCFVLFWHRRLLFYNASFKVTHLSNDQTPNLWFYFLRRLFKPQFIF